jgi:hypothetical protein
MSLKRWSMKRDGTEPEILDALHRVGADFIRLDAFDVLVLFRGQLTMLECKTRRGRATRNQTVLVQRGWPLRFVRTADEALQAIGVRAAASRPGGEPQ